MQTVSNVSWLSYPFLRFVYSSYGTCPELHPIYLPLTMLIQSWYILLLGMQKRNPTNSHWVPFGLRLLSWVVSQLANPMALPVGCASGGVGYNSWIWPKGFALLALSHFLITMWVILSIVINGA